MISETRHLVHALQDDTNIFLPFYLQDHVRPVGTINTHPNWKLQTIFKNLIHISKAEIRLRKIIAIDEDTMDLKLQHPFIIGFFF